MKPRPTGSGRWGTNFMNMASGTSGRKSRLSMYTLIQDGILTPGEKVLTFDYMVSKGLY